MVKQGTVIEDVVDEMAEMEPEVIESVGTQIEFPYARDLRLSNYIRFYHPDGTYSTLAAPTFNPARPTPYRRRFLQHWLGKKRNGKRWFFLKRQAPAPELPFRCFVAPGGEQCNRRCKSIPDLYMHIKAKHGEESALYADALEAMKNKMQAQLDPETIAALGLGETKEAPEAFYCRNEGCPRFFDNEASRNAHEYKCPQKES